MSTLTADRQALEAAIATRKSCRAFLQHEPVSREIIAGVLLQAAQAAPAPCDGAWKVYVLQGERRDALSHEVCEAHEAVFADPTLADRYRESYDYYAPSWNSPWIDRRRENGWSLYGLLGIAKGEKHKMHAQHHRNFMFFDAPVGLMFTLNQRLAGGSLLRIGTFIQSIMVAARMRGLHTCPQAAWNGYASIILPHVGAGADELLVCGMSLGYADTTALVDTFETPREPVDVYTRWL